MPDHVHMVLSIPPKYSVSSVLGYLKGKSAIMIHREMERVKHGQASIFRRRGILPALLAWMRK